MATASEDIGCVILILGSALFYGHQGHRMRQLILDCANFAEDIGCVNSSSAVHWMMGTRAPVKPVMYPNNSLGGELWRASSIPSCESACVLTYLFWLKNEHGYCS